VAAQVDRNAVLAPVEVLVGVVMGILIVQLAINRPGVADELADAQTHERRIARAAIVVLDVETGRPRQVPAVVEILRVGRLRERQASEQRCAQQADLHISDSLRNVGKLNSRH
jgi:hypothetical protein